MRIIKNYNSIPNDAYGSVIAIGNFDGLHLGHQKLIKEAMAIAVKENCPSAILTFAPHPLEILRPEASKFLLNNPTQKSELLQQIGIDIEFELTFDKEFSMITAEQFVNKILIESIRPSHVLIGHDFIFGHNRGGNAALLYKMLSESNIGFTQIASVGDSETYSSSLVRKYLQQGKLDKVSSILGRNHFIDAIVQRGNKLGATIGFPTANLDIGNIISPAYGVYDVSVTYLDKKYNAIANFGKKPTIGSDMELLEVHIFDFDHDIYGQEIRVEFNRFIRPERKFANIEELVKQIKLDCEQVKKESIK